MTATITTIPARDGNLTEFTLTIAQDSVSGNKAYLIYLAGLDGSIADPATAAKQPAPGAAGAPSADVITIQGIAGMMPVKTDGSSVTQPVSASALPLPLGAAQDATLTAGFAKAVMRGGKKGTTNIYADITHTPSGPNHEPIDVAIYDAGGNQLGLPGFPLIVDPAGKTTQPVSGTVTATSSIANPSSTLTRPASAVSAAVSFTNGSANFAWAGNPLANNQTVILSGAVPDGFTSGNTYFVVNVSRNNFQLSAALGGAHMTPGSTGTCTAALTYISGALIASATAIPVVVPSFSMNSSTGVLSRIRVLTNAASGWGGVNLAVNLWSAAPSYAGGDGSPYVPAAGSANWLANFLVSLTQFGDGAAGGGSVTSANAIALAAGTTVFWDLQILTQAAPFAGQTITIIPEIIY